MAAEENNRPVRNLPFFRPNARNTCREQEGRTAPDTPQEMTRRGDTTLTTSAEGSFWRAASCRRLPPGMQNRTGFSYPPCKAPRAGSPPVPAFFPCALKSPRGFTPAPVPQSRSQEESPPPAVLRQAHGACRPHTAGTCRSHAAAPPRK